MAIVCSLQKVTKVFVMCISRVKTNNAPLAFVGARVKNVHLWGVGWRCNKTINVASVVLVEPGNYYQIDIFYLEVY